MVKTELNLPVRYYETDQMGVVHHSNYVRYFECGRVDMLTQLGMPIEKIEEAGVMMPVVSVEARYKFPAKMGDVLKVMTYIDEVPRAKLVIRTEVYNPDGMLTCEGTVTLGFLDSVTRRPVRCPATLSEIIEKHIND